MSDQNEGIPELSHLQFLFLETIGANTMTGKVLRERLAEGGVRKSGPAFYQLMARLEEGKLVEGWYNQQVIDGQIIKERTYRITGHGVTALNATKRFYQNRTTFIPGITGPAFA